MLRSVFDHIIYIFIAIFALFTTVIYAQTPGNQTTIFDSSIKWDDINSRNELLKTVPGWNEATLKALFKAYLNLDNYGLPKPDNLQTHNVLFINAFWGPMNNPFNKSPRPAKAFVFFNQSNTVKTDFIMVPLIKNLADGNYYVFDEDHKQPILLNEWIGNFKVELRFNICNGYGNLPEDICASKGYAAEASDTPSFIVKDANKAHRDFNEDWKSKINVFQDGTIYDTSILWKNIPARNKLLRTVAAWDNFKIIRNNFEKIRDIRYFNDPEYPDFKRRISWLYPDDGCWTRATAVIRDLFGPFNNLNNTFTRPSKVFAFGNLCANTSNSPEGMVTWWYHTAPIVRDKTTNQTYVLDPSINPYQPITMEKWAEEIASHTGACEGSNSSVNKFNICNGYGTGPFDTCKDIYSNETASMLNQSSYQIEERYRQGTLGRDANAVLGDFPPWIN